MYTFSINTWSKNDIEAIKYNGKKWRNGKDLEKALGWKNLAGNKTQKKMQNTRLKIINLVENLLRKN